MPNWSNNTLTVVGKTSADLEMFMEKSRDGDQEFTLNGTYPMPMELDSGSAPYFSIGELEEGVDGVEKRMREHNVSFNQGLSEEQIVSSIEKRKKVVQKAVDNTEKYSYPSWYEWRNAKWGTKWDVADADVHMSEVKAEISFSTAWAPPVPWLEHVAPKFPNCKFSLVYREDGFAFEGVTYAFRGELDDHCREALPGFTLGEDWPDESSGEELKLT